MSIHRLPFAPRTEDDALPDLARKGRGSVSNRPSHRFGNADRYALDDGWSDHEREDWAKARRATVLGVDTARRIITRNTSPDIGFDRSINPYKGCEHGCIYCFARPSHAYLDLSPGIDFETRIFRKPDAPDLLRKELSAHNYRPGPMMLGINTDAYQPTERTELLTRRILEVLAEFRHPVHIVTKSALIQRDLDILAPMAAQGLFSASLSVTTLDRDLARVMEPRAATPQRRIDTIRALSQAGIPVGVLAAPMIPGLTDHELEAILKAAAEAGARRAGMTLIRLPHEIKTLFEEWLHQHVPGSADKVLNRIRQTRGGELYDATFGKRMTGTGQHADLMRRRFDLAVRRFGLDVPRTRLDYSQFRGGDPQMSLL
ncbi:PA0069 family radical SAM protein [Asticcacaulis sp. EMRT-3]|uniref:PA0069 family radical SAM protein n=1 Tax=Asticcacaulis sp. EMRT-3 TaxID=3040349 RepID=UPI0024AF6E99|nr:PA0069 family radical SAM protein [Asticcacaulis sp. EMRT-3]MDI7775446.1 PA0069 family radical SAM protein [Asticcacaulis sp. EMRT-3]